MNPDLDPVLTRSGSKSGSGLFSEVGSGSGPNRSRSATLLPATGTAFLGTGTTLPATGTPVSKTALSAMDTTVSYRGGSVGQRNKL
jgi:hypothetical protein